MTKQLNRPKFASRYSSMLAAPGTGTLRSDFTQPQERAGLGRSNFRTGCDAVEC
jgi:hypothetical protein